MRQENRLKRQSEIEQAAYALLREQGYGSISMLKIAKRAKASNETLYRWYGDKAGLFRALVAKNAVEARALLERAATTKTGAKQVLVSLGPVLLGILLGPHAIALNQAAAADPSGALGQAIAAAGRQSIMPLITQLMARGIDDADLPGFEADALAELYLTLLVGDLQIRRAIGQMAPPDKAFLQQRADQTLEQLLSLSARSGKRTG